MSNFLERAVKRGVRNAVGNAVEKTVVTAVAGAVAPAANAAAEKAATQFNQAVGANQSQQTQYGYPQQGGYQQQNQYGYQPNPQTQAAASTLGGMFASLQGAATSFANEAAKNMKQCPSCGEAAPAGNKFCPSCGSPLPEVTIAQGAVCASCGAQNSVGTKFCASCGAKLPAAVAEENAALARDAAVMAKWDSLLPQYPKWQYGGHDYSLEEEGRDNMGWPIYSFSARGVGYDALNAYRGLLRQYGFRPAGQYPSEGTLYNQIGGVCHCFESEEPFPGDPGSLWVHFCVREPAGGFHYVKPEPKKPASFRDILKNL